MMVSRWAILGISFVLADAWSPRTPPPCKVLRRCQALSAARSLGGLSASSNDAVFYFAYGANMNSAVFEGRRGIKPRSKEPAVALDTRLCFTALGAPPFEPAFASVEPLVGAHCHGVLYEISPWDWLRVCASEGVPFGYQIVPIRTQPYLAVSAASAGAGPRRLDLASGDPEEETVEARTLRFVQPQQALFNWPLLEPPGLLTPSTRYMTLLRQGAAEAGLAQVWRDKLDALPSVW